MPLRLLLPWAALLLLTLPLPAAAPPALAPPSPTACGDRVRNAYFSNRAKHLRKKPLANVKTRIEVLDPGRDGVTNKRLAGR